VVKGRAVGTDGLHERVVAVTGAARGIGRATAAALVAAGARVALGDLDQQEAARTAGRLGPAAVAMPLDVASRASFEQFLNAACDALGPLDALVNNAGIMYVGEFAKEEDEATRHQVEINLHGTLLGMKLVIPGMIERGRGHIVNIASVAGKVGVAGGATYSASKHAVIGATDALRAELRGTGVRLSVVIPAVVDTPLAAGLRRNALSLLTPEDVAAAVLKALRSGRAELHVPRLIGVLNAVLSPLPPTGRAAVAHWLGADRTLSGASRAARETYERSAGRPVSADPMLPEQAG
jgi:NADP-dependent 3-hydroxy acid dehydrogenase YdfG